MKAVDLEPRLRQLIAETVELAQREGVPLETFLTAQWQRMPPCDRDTMELMFGIAVCEWIMRASTRPRG